MDSQKRLLIALALSFVLTAVYMLLNPPKPSPDAAEGMLADGGTELRIDGGTVAPAPGLAEGSPLVAPGAEGGTDALVQGDAPPPAEPPVEARTLRQVEDEVIYSITNRGAGLVGAEFQGKKMREQRELSVLQGYKLLFGGEVPDAPQMDMAVLPPNHPPALAVGVTGGNGLDPWHTWRIDEGASKDNRIVFTTRTQGWEARKILEWTQSNEPMTPAGRGFELAMTLELKNTSSQTAQGELAVHYGRGIDPSREEKGSFISGGVGNESKATCYVNDELFQMVPGNDPIEPEKLRGPVSFFGVDQQYFLGAVFPLDQASAGRCDLVATPTGRVAVGYFPVNVPAGQTLVQRFGVYIGPKDADYLKVEPSAALFAATGVPPSAFNAALHKTVDYGIWEVICVVLLALLKFFHGIVGNWGVAIVLLTVTVKMVLLPLTWKSMMAAENMKKLQPKVEELRKKHEGDRERINMEMMKLYQEAKVNPLGGCLPLLLQMPVWIALFTTLRNSYEIYREPFIAPVWMDLTYKDPTYIFPVLLGVTMIATQKLQPAMMDKAQQKIMVWFMPIFFTLLMLAYPAGLTLYIFTNNVLSVVQQFSLRKWMEKTGRSAPPPAAATVPAVKATGRRAR